MDGLASFARATHGLSLPSLGVYDALGRRIAALQIIDNDPDEDQIALGRRYLYDGSMVASEYIFKPEAGEGETTYTTLENGYGELERIFVRGSILFCAIDHDQDSTLTNINDISECNWAGGLSTVCNDHAFYYYTDAAGNVVALGHKDDDQKILEYYRNRVFGEVVVLPIVDDGVAGGSTADDGIEDTPDDLSDNNSLMMTNRGLNGDYVGRVSEFGSDRKDNARSNDSHAGILSVIQNGSFTNVASGTMTINARGTVIATTGIGIGRNYTDKKWLGSHYGGGQGRKGEACFCLCYLGGMAFSGHAASEIVANCNKACSTSFKDDDSLRKGWFHCNYNVAAQANNPYKNIDDPNLKNEREYYEKHGASSSAIDNAAFRIEDAYGDQPSVEDKIQRILAEGNSVKRTCVEFSVSGKKFLDCLKGLILDSNTYPRQIALAALDGALCGMCWKSASGPATSLGAGAYACIGCSATIIAQVGFAAQDLRNCGCKRMAFVKT